MERSSEANIYAVKLSPGTWEWELHETFARYGKVGKISLDEWPHITSSYIFCFVEMPLDNRASAAMGKLTGKMLHGSALCVKGSAVGI